MTGKTDVMISYQWGHQKTAVAVKESLEAAGLTVWMDVERMRGNINDAMCEAVTESSVSSHNCKKELNFADEERKPLVPIRLDKGPLKWSRLITAGSLYVDLSEITDFKGKVWENRMESLTSEIRSKIKDLRDKEESAKPVKEGLKSGTTQTEKPTEESQTKLVEYAAFLASFGSAGKDIKQIITGLKMASDKNIPKAMTMYGYCLEKGFGVSKSPGAAFELYKRAVELGEPGAMNNIGHCYEHGIGCEKDLDMAFTITKFEKDTTQTAELFMKGMAEGDMNAGVNLGISLLHGHGVEKDVPEAVNILKKYAGNNAKAQNVLGDCYLRGIGVNPNPAKATELYMASSVRGNDRALIVSATATKMLYKKSSEKGNTLATTNIGACYQNGVGTEKNEKAAFECFDGAVKKGESAAYVKLATCYAKGIGTTVDTKKAAQVLLDPVVKDNVDVKETLKAFLAENLITVPEDVKKEILETSKPKILKVPGLARHSPSPQKVDTDTTKSKILNHPIAVENTNIKTYLDMISSIS
ncbi:hypothetical protein BC829DRAFT_416679 [Chytridium lagenaria]|nr:hypothetical protein BC829DRAFT_416679 [Chytridium lagenaria]